MATATRTMPQALNGEEIRRGIAFRIAAEMPAEHAEEVKEIIYHGLGKTCSLESSCAYAKFKADWKVAYWLRKEGPTVRWWVDYELDDFGRVTKNGIGNWFGELPEDTFTVKGNIPEAPPDKFRRETEQPIPKAAPLKTQDPQQSTFSKAARRGRPRKEV